MLYLPSSDRSRESLVQEVCGLYYLSLFWVSVWAENLLEKERGEVWERVGETYLYSRHSRLRQLCCWRRCFPIVRSTCWVPVLGNWSRLLATNQRWRCWMLHCCISVWRRCGMSTLWARQLRVVGVTLGRPGSCWPSGGNCCILQFPFQGIIEQSTVQQSKKMGHSHSITYIMLWKGQYSQYCRTRSTLALRQHDPSVNFLVLCSRLTYPLRL